MIKVGGRELIFNEQVIISHSEIIELTIERENLPLNVQISFSGLNDDKSPPLSWQFDNDILKMVFSNVIENVSPNTLQKPFRLGEFNNQTVGFTFAIQKIIDTYILHFQVMLGGEYDE